MSRRARRKQRAWAHNLWVSGRHSGCPHSFLQRSSAGCLPCSCVVELSGQLEVEEEDGDRQEEEEEVESGEGESKRVRHVDDHGWSVKCAQNLSHECEV